MEENILPQSPPTKPEGDGPKPRTAIIGVILGIFLFITLVLLGERIIFDLNRFANPAAQPSSTTQGYSRSVYGYEKSGLSDAKVYYRKDDKSQYMTYKLLIHAAFIIPIFMVVFLLYYLFNVNGNPVQVCLIGGELKSSHIMGRNGWE